MTESFAPDGHPGPEWLGAWHDGELTGEAADRVARHVDGCVDCRAFVADLVRIDELGPWLEEHDPAAASCPDLDLMLRHRLNEEIGLDPESDELEAGRPAAAGISAASIGRATREFDETPPAPRRGGINWRWSLATAASLTLVVLSIRLIERRSAVQMVIAPESAARRSAEAEKKETVNEFAGKLNADDKGAPESATPPPPTGAAAKPSKGSATMPSEGPATTTVRQLADAAPGPATTTAGELADATPVSESATVAVSPGPAGATIQTEPRATLTTEGVRGIESPGAGIDATARPADYAARVDRELGTRTEARSLVAEERDLGDMARMKATRPGVASPKLRFTDYQMAMAAALRAAEAGRYDLARDGFRLVRDGAPETPLAREAEYEERLAGYRQSLAGGEAVPDLLARAAREADESWRAASAGGLDGREAGRDETRRLCRQALADLRAWLALVHEKDPAARLDDAPGRLRQLQSCAR